MFPVEPFELDEAAVGTRLARLQASQSASKFEYKIADAVDRQQAFWYQVLRCLPSIGHLLASIMEHLAPVQGSRPNTS